MKEGSQTCKNDKCRKHEYQPPRQFNLKDFEQRMKRSAQRRSLKEQKIHEERRSSIIDTCQRRSRRQTELIEKASKEDFHTRMAKDIEARTKKIQTMEQTARALLEREHSFKPKLNVPEHLIRNRKGGFDNLSAPLRRYTEGYQPPADDVVRNTKKRRRTKMKPLETPWGSSQPRKKVDEDRLKKQFHRR